MVDSWGGSLEDVEGAGAGGGGVEEEGAAGGGADDVS